MLKQTKVPNGDGKNQFLVLQLGNCQVVNSLDKTFAFFSIIVINISFFHPFQITDRIKLLLHCLQIYIVIDV